MSRREERKELSSFSCVFFSRFLSVYICDRQLREEDFYKIVFVDLLIFNNCVCLGVRVITLNVTFFLLGLRMIATSISHVHLLICLLPINLLIKINVMLVLKQTIL